MDIFSALLKFTDMIGNVPLAFAHDAGNAILTLTNCLIANGFSSGCSALPTNFLSEVSSTFTNVTSFFTTGWANVINNLWYFIPDGGTFPTVIHSAAIAFGGAMSNLSFILPVHDLVLVMFLIFSIRATLIVYYLTTRAVNLVRGISTQNRF